MTTLILAGQVQLPTAPASTWDGVPGSDVIQTDPETREVTYPMGEQPANALALGCIFGRSNVRCPRSAEETRPSPRQTIEDFRLIEPDGSSPYAFFETGYGDGEGPAASDDFDSALRDARAEASPVQEESSPSPRAGCRREEARDPDTGSFSASLVCGSSNGAASEALERLRESSRPSSGY
ncbi:MAG: hypothetical protein KKG23_08995 [Alphaproteobacteria bacterium]|nr:hypothetical protein [Alphaproteobacteria bacterium]